MDQFKRLFAISAVVFIVFGIALALAVIVGIWVNFDSELVRKLIGTLSVLFFLTGVLHIVAKGMCEPPNDN